MTTSKYIYSLFLASVALFFVVSCDKIDAPYVIPNQPVDTAACPVPEFPVVTAHYKRALLEDYTGHTCPNCPRAAVTARELKEHYKDSLVVMAVHAGWFANVNPGDPVWSYDFRSTAGTDWDTYFEVGKYGNPNGMVSRKGYPDNKQVVKPALWADAVNTTVAEAPLMDLQLITEYNAGEDKLCIHAKTSFLSAITGRSLNLSVVVVEDSITQAQYNGDPTVGETPHILDYVHMHVMRGSVNGTWGTPILSKDNASGEAVTKTFPMHFTGFNLNTMVPKNCRVIAFVYDIDTKEVLQAAEAAVGE